jgi:uncharacterized membrane protein YbhN (UPF0104 family)
MKRFRGQLLFAGKIVVSFGLLYFAVHSVNFEVLRERLGHVEAPWVAAILAALALQTALVALRWQRIAEDCGSDLSVAHAIRYTFIGAFFSQVLPSTVGGDAARMWLLAREAGAWKGAIVSVLIDRLVGLIWLAAIVLVCLPWSLALIQNPVGRTALIVIGIAGALAPLGLLVFSQFGRTSFMRWAPGRHIVDVSTIALRVLSPTRNGAVIALISIVVHGSTVLLLWMCARATGSPFTLLDSLLLIPPVILIAAIPVSIAGWGLRESAMIAAFTYAGLPGSDGLLASVLFGAGGFAIGALGGLIWICSANRVRLGSLQEASQMARDV